MAIPEIELTVYPDECDAYGHLNQASFLALFERARWELLSRGPGMDVFSRHGTWPAVRRATIDYQAPAFPGDKLRFGIALLHLGRTSLSLRQSAHRAADDSLIATAEFVFVCINAEGRPVPVPAEVGEFFGAGADTRSGMRQIRVNGVTLQVQVEGEGPAILFVHGYPLDHTIWAAPVAQLDGWRRIAPDLRGFGGSDAPDLGYSMATYAQDLAALLDTLGINDVVLCGLSMGGYVAFEFLRRWRDRVRALVLMDTRAEPDTLEGKRLRDQHAAQAREAGARAIADHEVFRLVAGRATIEIGAQVHKMITSTPVPGIVGALGAMRDRPDSRPLLPELSGMPVLVVGGMEDQIIPPEQIRELADAIPGAQLILIDGAGHLPPVERPEQTVAALRDFLARLPATQATAPR
ncbi:MAG TPA: alpha/beta fold hydrolase [Gemmatimonadales bacterium]|nr:alpha/beta fold hydrolase [Gemmatimonadales bacterium]